MDFDDVDLIRCFSHGAARMVGTKKKRSNSACIAIIKASISIFGIDRVVFFTKESDHYYAILRNGTRITFTETDLQCSNLISDFQLNTVDPGKFGLYQSLYSYSQLLQCTMAVMLSKKGVDGQEITTFDTALVTLNSGVSPLTLISLLGLENHYTGRSFFDRLLKSPSKGMVAWMVSKYVFLSEEIYDNDGVVGHLVNRYPFRIQICFKVD
jgi:hypothetical protein